MSTACEAGHPDEDEGYENNVTDTNMVYTVDGDELVPLEKFWGVLPRIEMLDPSKVSIF
jgi:supervillin